MKIIKRSVFAFALSSSAALYASSHGGDVPAAVSDAARPSLPAKAKLCCMLTGVPVYVSNAAHPSLLCSWKAEREADGAATRVRLMESNNGKFPLMSVFRRDLLEVFESVFNSLECAKGDTEKQKKAISEFEKNFSDVLYGCESMLCGITRRQRPEKDRRDYVFGSIVTLLGVFAELNAKSKSGVEISDIKKIMGICEKSLGCIWKVFSIKFGLVDEERRFCGRCNALNVDPRIIIGMPISLETKFGVELCTDDRGNYEMENCKAIDTFFEQFEGIAFQNDADNIPLLGMNMNCLLGEFACQINDCKYYLGHLLDPNNPSTEKLKGIAFNFIIDAYKSWNERRDLKNWIERRGLGWLFDRFFTELARVFGEAFYFKDENRDRKLSDDEQNFLKMNECVGLLKYFDIAFTHRELNSEEQNRQALSGMYVEIRSIISHLQLGQQQLDKHPKDVCVMIKDRSDILDDYAKRVSCFYEKLLNVEQSNLELKRLAIDIFGALRSARDTLKLSESATLKQVSEKISDALETLKSIVGKAKEFANKMRVLEESSHATWLTPGPLTRRSVAASGDSTAAVPAAGEDSDEDSADAAAGEGFGKNSRNNRGGISKSFAPSGEKK